MPKIFPRYTQDIPKICPRYAQNMPEICPRYARDMPKTYAKKSWGKMSTIILELGHYVPLPKFCAIWGKMSRGILSWGILSFGAKCLLAALDAFWHFWALWALLGTFAKNGQKVPRVALENYILNFFWDTQYCDIRNGIFPYFGLAPNPVWREGHNLRRCLQQPGNYLHYLLQLVF